MSSEHCDVHSLSSGGSFVRGETQFSKATLQQEPFMGVNALNFAGFHPYSPMFFFPSNMSTCKLWQKCDYALRTRELNFPKMETFKGNSVVFNSVFVCTANHVHQVGKAALRGFFSLPSRPHETFAL